MCSPPSDLEDENCLSLAVKYSEWPPANWLHKIAKEDDCVSIRFGGDFHYPDKDTDTVKDHSVSVFQNQIWLIMYKTKIRPNLQLIPNLMNFNMDHFYLKIVIRNRAVKLLHNTCNFFEMSKE